MIEIHHVGVVSKDLDSALRYFQIDKSQIDEIIDEPVGGAHREHVQIIMQTKIAIKDSIISLKKFDPESLVEKRRDKFLEIGRNLNI